MAHRAGGRERGAAPGDPRDPGALAYLRDYELLVNSVPFPSAVFDHRWDVVLANSAFDALFGEVGAHPTAMPDDNFLRFVLFHPDAGRVLGDHEASWCLPMLAHFARAVEEHPKDGVLQSVRREIARDPIMEAAYRQGLPHWLRAVGQRAVEHDGSVRPLRHPDPRWGHTHCRVVGATPRALEGMGYRHLTLVLRERPRRAPHGSRRHLRAVPAGG
ncbi:hypothetical protein [Streptomyces sp. NPDC050560]|uniref:MmyB family transcriptional regulator n=1 Tax=Streptomyces sp. NPDC050560 TaxID=3365630 RepID=UPI0037ACBA61